MFDDYDYGAFNYEIPSFDLGSAAPSMDDYGLYDFQGEAHPGYNYLTSFDPTYLWGQDVPAEFNAAKDSQLANEALQAAGIPTGAPIAPRGVDLGTLGGVMSTEPGWLDKLLGGIKGLGGGTGGKVLDLLTSRGGVAGIGALLSYLDRQKPTGGGTSAAYAGYKPLTRTTEQGRYGPIERHAAQGGLMQAYAQGGVVKPFPMQDGGFVMTKRAVDGAGGEGGMKRHVPEAVPIRGPGHGTSDSIPAEIHGKHGVTPAKVSNGEMYVPPGRNTQGLYALMKSLERKA